MARNYTFIITRVVIIKKHFDHVLCNLVSKQQYKLVSYISNFAVTHSKTYNSNVTHTKSKTACM